MPPPVSAQSITQVVRDYLRRESTSWADGVDDSTNLFKAGILDSLASAKLIAFLEEHYKIEIPPSKLDPRHLNNLRSIVALVQSELLRHG